MKYLKLIGKSIVWLLTAGFLTLLIADLFIIANPSSQDSAEAAFGFGILYAAFFILLLCASIRLSFPKIKL